MNISAIDAQIPNNEISNDYLVDLISFYSKNNFDGNIQLLQQMVLKSLEYMGAEKRYWRTEREKPIDLVEKSLESVLIQSKLSRQDIDLVIFCGIDKPFAEPSTANHIANELGLYKARCFDISDACMSWFTSIQTAYELLKSNRYSNALIISSEFPMDNKGSIIPENFTINRIEELEYKLASLTIGESCSCTILRNEKLGDFKYCFISDSKNSHLCTVPFPNFKKYVRDNSKVEYFKDPMKFTAFGREMNKKGRGFAKQVVEQFINKYGMPDIFIPHSMSMVAIESIAKELNLMDKIHMTFKYLGNTASNSIPVGLHSLILSDKTTEGKDILCCLGGAGFKYCSFLINLE